MQRNIFLWAALLSSAALASSVQIKDAAPPTFRVSTNMVIADVSVRDSKQVFAGDLKASNFQIRDDGKPQEIKYFSVSHRDTSRDRIVIVIDMASTTAAITKTLADELAKSLAARSCEVMVGSFNGQRVAILLPFTSDRAKIVEAVRAAPVTNTPPAELSEIEGEMDQQRNIGSNRSTRDQANSRDRSMTPGTASREAAVIARNYLGGLAATGQNMQRGMTHFFALLASYPERKNLLWITDTYPLAPWAELQDRARGPEPWNEKTTALRDMIPRTSITADITDIGAAANSVGVSIYPVDWRTYSVETMQRFARVGGGVARVTYFNQLNEPVTSNDMLASLTGGFPIYFQNELDKGLGRVRDDSADYYVIGFQPEEDKHPHFHKLDVKVDHPGLAVRTSRGYSSGVSEDAMVNSTIAAVFEQPSAANAIPFDSRVQTQSGKVVVDLNIPVDHVTFTPRGEGMHVDLSLLGLVTRPDGTPVSNEYQIKRPYSITLGAKQFEAARAKNVVATRNEFALPEGDYMLTLVLRDSATGAIGASRQGFSVKTKE